MHDVLLLLGSNLEKEQKIPAACAALAAMPETEVITVSSIYASTAIGADGKPSDQPAFHNVAVHIQTAMPPADLRNSLRTIERELGRVRSADKFAARPIDIDISLYGEEILNLDGSQIPDPEIASFPHIAIPLAEIAPDWVLPTTGQRLDMIAGRLQQTKTECM